MLNIRPILFVIGALLTILSIAMFIPAYADYVTLDDNWKPFLISSFFTAFCGISLLMSNYTDGEENLSLKQAFVLTTVSWVVLAVFAALPLRLSNVGLSMTDAFFESMSGLTTTGSTVMTGLDHMPAGVLLWRSILQWLGGIGIIVMAMAILPILKIGGMQLFRTESSDNTDKVLPRVTQLCGMITLIYGSFTLIFGLSFWFAGMSAFDSLNHALTTAATGGFSTHDDSIGYFNSPTIEMLMVLFMIIGSIPFVLYIQFLHGKPRALFKNSQVRWFLSLLAIAVSVISLWLSYSMDLTIGEAFRKASFNMVSIITTTGFTSADYNQWGGFVIVCMFVLAVSGGCTGSTTGGIKIFRFQVLLETAKTQISRLIQPHGVFHPVYNNRPISDEATSSVMSFIILFALCFSAVAVLLSFTGVDFITAMSGAGSVMANVGPGLGDVIGPTGNYSSLTDLAKWILAFGMLLGRLEIFTVLILFSPYFWKN